MTAAPTKGERSRHKLVTATAELLRRQGYHATGLAEIVAESGAPRGSLYFYFPGGKDELACAALDASGVEWRRRIAAATRDAADLGAAIDAIVTLLGDDLEASGYQHGCPAAAVALEATSEPVRATVAAQYAAWEAAIADRMVSFGIARPVARQLATVALASIEGALLLAKVSRSRAPLAAVGAALRAMATRMPTPVPPVHPRRHAARRRE
jgi:TetR/AcrR family transcriptional repressor of lmrAB and yxaGH operons